MIPEQTASKWVKHSRKMAKTNSPSVEDQRRNKFERGRSDVAESPNDRAEMSRSARMTDARKSSGETRNRFGDPQQDATDPRKKPLRETVWGESARVQRNATGMPMDAETRELREAMKSDLRVSDLAAGRAPSEVNPQVQKPQPTAEDIQAFVLFLSAAHPDMPLDERRGPNDGSEADERYRAAVLHNAHQLRKMWLWLVYKKVAQLDLAGLMLAYDQCLQGSFLDDGQPRKRGFGNHELINVVCEPPQQPEDRALAEAMKLVRTGRARFEKTRPANEQEEAEIRNLRAMPFSELRKAATSK